MLKVSNRNTRTRCEICSKITIKTPERRHWRRSGVFNVNFEHISHVFWKTLAVFTESSILMGFWKHLRHLKFWISTINTFSINVSLLHLLKTSENLRVFYVFWGYRSGTLVENGLIASTRLLIESNHLGISSNRSKINVFYTNCRLRTHFTWDLR